MKNILYNILKKVPYYGKICELDSFDYGYKNNLECYVEPLPKPLPQQSSPDIDYVIKRPSPQGPR